MNKITLYFLSACVVLLIAFTTVVEKVGHTTKSAGPPPYNTGAPGEQTCASDGCHDGFGSLENSGPGMMTMVFNNGTNTYEIGKAYDINVKISETSMLRFGFQMVALDSNNANAGYFIVTNETRTQKRQPDYGDYQDRVYIMHTKEGISPVQTGVGEWSFKWEAMQNMKSPITFYLAALGANYDETDTLDHTYTSALTVPELLSTEIAKTINSTTLHAIVFPNPLRSGSVNISFSSENREPLNLKLYDIQGKLILQKSSSVAVNGQLQLDLISVEPGIYFLVCSNGSTFEKQKLVIE